MTSSNLPGKATPHSETEVTFPIRFNIASAIFNESFGHEGNIIVGETPKHVLEQCIGLKLRYNREGWLPGGVILKNGPHLETISGNGRIRPRTSGHGIDHPVGNLSYFGGLKAEADYGVQSLPAAYYVDLSVPEDQYNQIVSHFRQGKLPLELSVHVRGLSLPSEFQYCWDASSTPVLPIVYFTAGFLAAVDCSIDQGNVTRKFEEPPYYPTTKADFGEMLQKATINAERMKVLIGLVGWIAGGVAAIAAALALLAVIAVWRLL